MAFATSNVAAENSGSNHVVRGSWTGTVGDAAGSVTGKGHALAAEFLTNLSTGPANVVPVRISNSSGDWTVTVPNVHTVTDGTYKIEFK